MGSQEKHYMVQPSSIKALAFDVFGTVVDWRGSIIREGERLGDSLAVAADWAAFADEWRDGYKPAMDRVRRGDLPWTKIDELHLMVLDELLVKFGIEGLDEAGRDHLNRVWHRLTPWSDVVEGLARLRRSYVVATLSNGNMSLLTNMAKHAGLQWDCILSSELARCYKPDPEVYETAAGLLGLNTGEVMMVAAHKHDLDGAKATGMRTAFVPRPGEFGPKHNVDIEPDPAYDVHAVDFLDLARKLDA